ncbi:hypothetical protein AGABI2DRAFT_143340 [Agaricus bisporus var. bisporus H97]|uniref:hypothetical protein n=1 Tax=Agaricus bisporus var. bisporus (strain H97 / ATCC MYA-4626 / FGSC 10389) TaxID=936046 RepID=UPI00029F5232|nr:hypothetical protein AGABI2DRAFT_143340 [Agaricus bisporus var. bisporus H97]EKV47804.1 hypothetical protein AGABI2DRAFT_143340 [Agaricus bisporus var. bisporus H97]
MLSDSEDNDDLHQITVNEHYAKAFQYRKEREELDKLKAKLGSDISESDLENEESDSESDESEDEDGEELTMAVDAAILRTLARIKRKDPSIYESGKNVFGEEQEKLAAKTMFVAPSKNRKDTAKPVTMRQVALEAQLNPSRSPSPSPPTHVQEQAALREETISAFHTAVNDDTSIADDDQNDDDLLVLREKTKDERKQEEEDYRAFLEREVGDLQEIIGVKEEDAVGEQDGVGEVANKKKKKKGKEDKPIKDKKQTKKEEEDQQFLMSYILNRGWIDKSRNHIPTYSEITSKKKSSKRKHTSQSDSEEVNAFDDDDNQSDSSFDSLMDHFESSYNHRFEEPGSSTIPSFPRTLSTLVRREDSKRKEARERKKSRKQEELEKKKEEVRRLKALKMREVRRKLEKVGIEGGLIKSSKSNGQAKKSRSEEDWDEENGGGDEGLEMDDALKELDLEGDWDPEKHDRQMAGLFAEHDGYDDGGEGDNWEDEGQVDEDGKPVWEDDIDIGDIYVPDEDQVPVPVESKKDKKKKKKKKKKDGVEVENTGVDVDAMDADVQPQDADDDEEEEEWDGTEEMRKRKLDEYMEEIYNLDFNDMVGDLPTRFNYAPVAKQTYALSPSEILFATDKELNEFMSIKRYAPYKTDARKWDTERQRKLRELQATLKEREKTGGWLIKDSEKNNTDGHGERRWQPSEEGKPAKKRKGKKERLKARAAALGEGGDDNDMDTNGRDDATKTEGHRSSGGNAEIEKSNSTQSKGKETGHKRKREDHDGGATAEVTMESVSGGVDSASQGQKKQRQEKEKLNGTEKKGDENDDGKPKKKRRRKHKKSGEEVAD